MQYKILFTFEYLHLSFIKEHIHTHRAPSYQTFLPHGPWRIGQQHMHQTQVSHHVYPLIVCSLVYISFHQVVTPQQAMSTTHSSNIPSCCFRLCGILFMLLQHYRNIYQHVYFSSLCFGGRHLMFLHHQVIITRVVSCVGISNFIVTYHPTGGSLQTSLGQLQQIPYGWFHGRLRLRTRNYANTDFFLFRLCY